MTDDKRAAQIARQYFEVDNYLKNLEKGLKAEHAKEYSDRKRWQEELYAYSGKVSMLIGKIFFLFSETVKASVPKAVSDSWTEEQWAQFEALGGERKVERALKSVTERF